MVKKVIGICLMLILCYVGYIQVKLVLNQHRHPLGLGESEQQRETPMNKVYQFSFSKFDIDGGKEFEIEGDTANIFESEVILKNVLAKALAQETPMTITSDDGLINKKTNDMHFEHNVIVSTETGTRLLTEKLDVQPTRKRVETDVHAKMKRGNINVEGIGASGDSELKQIEFQKNVVVVIQSPDDPSEAPTIITCDGPLEIDYELNIAHFSKNVVAKDQRGRLMADFMDVYYSSETKKVHKIVTTGNVIIKSKDGNTTYSDNAIYLAEEGKIILGGDVETFSQSKKNKHKSKAPTFQFMGQRS